MRARYSAYFLNHVLLLQDELATYYVQDRFSIGDDFLGVELKTFFDHREAVEWLKDCVSYDNSGIRNLRYFLDESAPHSYALYRWEDYEVMDEAARVIMDDDYPVVISPIFESAEFESEIFDVICALRDGALLSVAVGSNGSLLKAANILNQIVKVHMKYAGSDWDKGQAALKNVNPFKANTVPGSWKMPQGRQNQFVDQVIQRIEAGLIPILKHSDKGWSDPSAALKVIINALTIILNISIDSFQKALRHPIDFFVLEPIKDFSSIFKIPEPNPNRDKSDLDIMAKYKLSYDIHPDDLDSADYPWRVDEWMRKKRNQLDSTPAFKGLSWPTPEQAEQIFAVVIMIYVSKKASTYIKPKIANSKAYQKVKRSAQKVIGQKAPTPGVPPVKNPPPKLKADNAANKASGKPAHSPAANKPKTDKKVANTKDVSNDGPKTTGKTKKEDVLTKLNNNIEFRKRTLELAKDPDRKELLIREGIGAARFEQATGRTVIRSTDGATDFVDSKLGAFDLKGPIRANDGSVVDITPKRVEGLGKSVIKEANRSTASKAVVVDTLGLSKEQVSLLKSQVEAGLKTDKPIFYIE